MVAGHREEKGDIGENADAETGLIYLHACYDDPAIGRFVSPDWWDLNKPGFGTNRYGYSDNDPIKKSAEYGHTASDPGADAAGQRDGQRGPAGGGLPDGGHVAGPAASAGATGRAAIAAGVIGGRVDATVPGLGPGGAQALDLSERAARATVSIGKAIRDAIFGNTANAPAGDEAPTDSKASMPKGNEQAPPPDPEEPVNGNLKLAIERQAREAAKRGGFVDDFGRPDIHGLKSDTLGTKRDLSKYDVFVDTNDRPPLSGPVGMLVH